MAEQRRSEMRGIGPRLRPMTPERKAELVALFDAALEEGKEWHRQQMDLGDAADPRESRVSLLTRVRPDDATEPPPTAD